MISESMKILSKLGACGTGREWVEEQRDQSPEALWLACPRADWLAWYLGHVAHFEGQDSPFHKQITKIACSVARSVSDRWPDSEIDGFLATIERWASDDPPVPSPGCLFDVTTSLYAISIRSLTPVANFAVIAARSAAALTLTTNTADHEFGTCVRQAILARDFSQDHAPLRIQGQTANLAHLASIRAIFPLPPPVR